MQAPRRTLLGTRDTRAEAFALAEEVARILRRRGMVPEYRVRPPVLNPATGVFEVWLVHRA